MNFLWFSEKFCFFAKIHLVNLDSLSNKDVALEKSDFYRNLEKQYAKTKHNLRCYATRLLPTHRNTSCIVQETKRWSLFWKNFFHPWGIVQQIPLFKELKKKLRNFRIRTRTLRHNLTNNVVRIPHILVEKFLYNFDFFAKIWMAREKSKEHA